MYFLSYAVLLHNYIYIK